eukprot:3230543-Prymnesium_polylepis.2
MNAGHMTAQRSPAGQPGRGDPHVPLRDGVWPWAKETQPPPAKLYRAATEIAHTPHSADMR